MFGLSPHPEPDVVRVCSSSSHSLYGTLQDAESQRRVYKKGFGSSWGRGGGVRIRIRIGYLAHTRTHTHTHNIRV